MGLIMRRNLMAENEINYIDAVRFDRNQYVVLDYVPSEQSRIVVKLRDNGTSSDAFSIAFAAQGPNNTQRFLLFKSTNDYGSQIAFPRSNNSLVAFNDGRLHFNHGIVYTFDFDCQNETVGNGFQSVNYSFSGDKNYDENAKLTFGTRVDSSGEIYTTKSNWFNGDIFDIKTYDSEVLTHHYRPAIKEGVPMLFDEVEKKWFGSSSGNNLLIGTT